MNMDEAAQVLSRTPAVLRAMLEGLPAGWLARTEGPETFDPVDVLCHLIHGEEADWIPRLRIMMEWGEAQPFEPFDRFAGARYRAFPLPELLEKFRKLREKNLRTLRENQDLLSDLAGTHPAFGRVTAEQLIATWVAHDLGHISQIARVMAKRYTEAVGPWREYLSILR